MLIRGALRRLRKGNKLDRKEAAKLAKVTEWTLHRHETEELAPVTLRDYIVKEYMKAYKCPAESFVTWVDHNERPRRLNRIKDPAAPRIATLTERAGHELAIGAKKTISLRNETIEVVGTGLIQDCMTAFALHEGKGFAVEGIVSDTRYLPDIAARALGAQIGAGASFRIDREIVKGLPVYVSVFTRRGEHTRELLERHRARKEVTVLVRIFTKPPEGEWKGFLIFEKKPKPRPWIFVVDEILPAAGTRT
jgi:hypothetical protein